MTTARSKCVEVEADLVYAGSPSAGSVESARDDRVVLSWFSQLSVHLVSET
jgi:hypothetical protein